ncbi:MAG: hemolysin family protein [Pseudomonadota bacterium]
MTEDDDPSSMKAAPSSEEGKGGPKSTQKNGGLLANIKALFSKPKNGNDSLREVLEEYIEKSDEEPIDASIAAHESAIISNVLKLRDRTAIDVMIPRADIAAIEVEAGQEELMELLSKHQFSRIPVYRDNMDNILGTVHIKDILSHVAGRLEINLRSLIRPVPIVSPSLPVLDLLLKMQSDKKHMVLVVDEYGGIDGLATIGDVIEAIVGEFDDEFDTETAPQMTIGDDGSVTADARFDVEDFEEKFGKILTEEEREEVDTLGGLVFFTASRIPARGEIIKHESGMVFEIVDADQRKINRLRIQNIPSAPAESQ